MGDVQIIGSPSNPLGGPLEQLFELPALLPNHGPSYQLCKTIMAYHPLGAKMTDSPIALAQSQERKITVQKGPEERLVEAFQAEWEAIGADSHLFNVARLARGYGIASIALLCDGQTPDQPIDYEKLWEQDISINVFDPLNTAGSLTLNQNPNAMDFQKVRGIAVSGVPYHRSRSVTLQNEHPLYIEWTSSAYGFTGRSVFQRALFPLRSFLRSMIADDLLELKVGVLVAKMKPPGSIADRAQQVLQGIKRNFVKEAQTGNVLGITTDEEIESLDFTNMEGPHALARKNILDNIATAGDMPAIILNQETFAEGFGEGTEDAKRVSQYINRIRVWMKPSYSWFDKIVMHRAWNPDFYKMIQRDFPDEYGRRSYREAFYEWSNSFRPIWPNLIEEPDSEKIKVDDVKLKAVIAVFEVFEPVLQSWPEGVGILMQWVADCFNERKELFPSPLTLDFDELVNALEQRQEQQDLIGMMGVAGGDDDEEPKPAPPFSARDSLTGDIRQARVQRALGDLTTAVRALPDLRARFERARRAAR